MSETLIYQIIETAKLDKMDTSSVLAELKTIDKKEDLPKSLKAITVIGGKDPSLVAEENALPATAEMLRDIDRDTVDFFAHFFELALHN